jgi:hypothetical protein
MDTLTVTKENSEHKENAFSIQGFEHAQRIAQTLSESGLVPEIYRLKPANCLIALEMANRIGVSPLMVMQNLHVIKGKPSWSSPFIIASINTCGRFQALKFRSVGGQPATEAYGYEAYTKDKSGEELVGPAITWKMVKSEGWLDKDGSKWKTMPELMFRYRAAAFFGRLYAPDILMGMQSSDEVIDVESVVVEEKKDKAAERIELLIKDARNLQDLQAIRDHVKPEQMEFFNEKMRDLS